MKFKGISYSFDRGVPTVTLELLDGKQVRTVTLSKRDLNAFLLTIISAFGLRVK